MSDQKEQDDFEDGYQFGRQYSRRRIEFFVETGQYSSVEAWLAEKTEIYRKHESAAFLKGFLSTVNKER